MDWLIESYPAYYCTSSQKLRLFGRVIRAYSDANYRETSNRFKYLLKVVRLFFAVSVPNEHVYIRVGSESFQIKTNDQGYFNLFVTLKHEPQLIDSKSEHEPMTIEVAYHFHGKTDFSTHNVAYIDSDHTEELFVSDIDDTILKSRATSFIRMALRTLFLPPHKRKMFPEVTRVYQELRKKNNLFFYVSSSTWEIYPLLKEFLDFNKMPIGPLILQDVRGEKAKGHTTEHGHKKDRIIEIIECYPNLLLTLIGDAGQADQHIYLMMAKAYPDRIKQIWIRRTWWSQISNDPEHYKNEASSLGIPLLYFDSLEDIVDL